ncbi:hypothetical protein G7046_g1456 [Stylonectria norvegica]|nr:hypothetical protein G7046_g1456 [Stylonectria norvegica]
MERTSKLADLKLVSKYYPVANYSYPKLGPERSSQHDRRRFSDARSSLGSEASAPGLIDDRTDSEVSLDDDYQYHAHATELWDSFWQPAPVTETKDKVEEPEPQLRKQYPALIPSPQHRRKQGQEDRQGPAWPLPESPRPRNRKPAATYSPFPKPFTLPPRSTSLVPSWQSSRSMAKPQRPPRPDDLNLGPWVQQLSPLSANFASSPEAHQTTFPSSPKPHQTNFPRPVTPAAPTEHRATTSLEIRPVTPLEPRHPMHSVVSRSATHLPLPEPRPFAPVVSGKKSMPCLRPVLPELEPEPHSVFELDDSDSESEAHRPYFFRFHKRSDSDVRRIDKSADLSLRPGHRRASTAPSSPSRNRVERFKQKPPKHEPPKHEHPKQEPPKHEPPGRKRQGGDILGHILGRRSR